GAPRPGGLARPGSPARRAAAVPRLCRLAWPAGSRRGREVLEEGARGIRLADATAHGPPGLGPGAAGRVPDGADPSVEGRGGGSARPGPPAPTDPQYRAARGLGAPPRPFQR